jgi:hypothetical protein
MPKATQIEVPPPVKKHHGYPAKCKSEERRRTNRTSESRRTQHDKADGLYMRRLLLVLEEALACEDHGHVRLVARLDHLEIAL